MDVMTKKEEARIKRQIGRKWHHDIKYIDGRFVEDVVLEYKQTRDEETLRKIIDNFSIFKLVWAQQFARYLDSDIEAGKVMHDEIIWMSATKFQMNKARKANGRAFNAYLVSAMMNQIKNHRNTRMSHKNHPRVMCPICKEEVYMIDDKHLEHRVDLAKYKKLFPKYPLVSMDGMTRCPMNGRAIPEITRAHLNRINKSYTLQDFKEEYWDLLPVGTLRCPVSGTPIENLTLKYPSYLMSGYSEQEFISDFPGFEGIITCPFSGRKTLQMTQAHLDKVLHQPRGDKARASFDSFRRRYPNMTLKARKIKVRNPYNGRMVWDLTPVMLSEAGTTWRKHMENFATLWLDKRYYELITCPFTGRRTHSIKTSDLKKIKRSVREFYAAVCKYPLCKWQVKCGLCGHWVDNIWEHLADKKHVYARDMTLEQFHEEHGSGNTKAVITTNSFVENESGDSVYLGDLFQQDDKHAIDYMEIEDSLMHVATNDLDRSIAKAIRNSYTISDLVDLVCQPMSLDLPFSYSNGLARAVRDNVQQQIGLDFDLACPPEKGARKVSVVVPSRQTVIERLHYLVDSSDL